MTKKGSMRIKQNGEIVNYYPSTTYDMVIDEHGESLSTDIPLLKTFKSTADTKLQGIAIGATKTENSTTNGNIKINDVETNIYSHPTSTGNKHIPSGGSAGQILRWSTDGTAVWGADNNTTYTIATQSANGLMSSTDKTKLDGIENNATRTILNNTVSSTSTTEAATANAVKTAYDKANHSHPYAATNHGNHVPTKQTADNSTFLRNDNTWQTITPSNIGAAKRYIVSDTETFINEPVAHFKRSMSNLVGTIKIALPKTWSDTMISLDIICYDYSMNGRYIYHVSGYTASSTTSWSAAQFSTEGNPKTTTVRFAHDDSKCCILLGGVTSTWSYPSFTVTNLKVGHSNTTGWEDGWSISYITNETGITNVVNGTNTTWSDLPSGTTSVKGIVQLSTATNSTSTSLAATASAVKSAYDKANHSHNYLPLSGGTMTENIDYTMYSSTQTPVKIYGGDTNGQGISIGAGGATIISSGEGKGTIETNIAATSEIMVMGSDQQIEFHTALQSGWANRKSMTMDTDGKLANNNGFVGPLTGNASTATNLQTARTINGTSFNGAANITTSNWGTARTLTIGSTGKSVNGAGNVSWSLSEIGAAAANHTHNYAGSSSAGGAATTALTCTGNSATATMSNFLKPDKKMEYGWGGVNYFSTQGPAGAGVKVNDAPTNRWWHIMRFNHKDAGGYYTDLAIPFEDDSLYYKSITYDILRHTGWVKVLDAINYDEFVPTKSGKGAFGTWDISVTGNASTATKLQTARTINGTSFNGAANITTANWGTARTLTIGSTGKSVNGAGNVSWSLSEIGAAAANHTHDDRYYTESETDAKLKAINDATLTLVTLSSIGCTINNSIEEVIVAMPNNSQLIMDFGSSNNTSKLASTLPYFYGTLVIMRSTVHRTNVEFIAASNGAAFLTNSRRRWTANYNSSGSLEPWHQLLHDDDVSNPNLLINGCFDVWQRGTKFTIPGGSKYVYTADRWAIQTDATSSPVVSKSATGGLIVNNSAFNGTYLNVCQFLDLGLYDKIAGKNVTVTIKLKSAAARLYVGFRAFPDASSSYYGVYDSDYIVFNSDIPKCSTTCTKFLVYIQSTIKQTFEIEYIKLELGPAATPIFPKTYTEELALCQRYYCMLNNNYIGMFDDIFSSSNGAQFICYATTPEMRVVNPDLSFASNATLIAPGLGSITLTPGMVKQSSIHQSYIFIEIQNVPGITNVARYSWGALNGSGPLVTPNPISNKLQIYLDAEIY